MDGRGLSTMLLRRIFRPIANSSRPAGRPPEFELRGSE